MEGPEKNDLRGVEQHEDYKTKAALLEYQLKEATRQLQEQREYNNRMNHQQSIEQDLKAYNNIKNINIENTANEAPVTFLDLKEEAKKQMMEERNDFLANTLYGDAVSTGYRHGNNKRHYIETAVINIYEHSDPTFKQLVGEKMELLKKCDYGSILNLEITEEKNMLKFYKEITGENLNRRTNSSQAINELARELMYKRSKLI